MTRLAIIGGSGLTALEGLVIQRKQMQPTPYGEPSGPLIFGLLHEKEVVFLPRHGNPHAIPPHRINYRANLWALKENSIESIIAVNAVGGITREMYPGRLAIPSQIIDYTSGRQHTYFAAVLFHACNFRRGFQTRPLGRAIGSAVIYVEMRGLACGK